MINKNICINLFTNNFRSINVIKLLIKKFKIKNIFLAKKNLSSKLLDFLKKNKIKYTTINKINHPTISKSIKENRLINVVCGFPYFFPLEFIQSSKNPIINCHGGNLPNYRGGSTLSWQIINNEKNIYISTLEISQGIDDGKILLKKHFRLKTNMNILDVQNKANSIFPKLVVDSINLILNKKKLKPQIGMVRVYKQRFPENSFFNPKNTKYSELRNLHRATFPLYCPPFFVKKKKFIYIEDFKITNLKKDNKKFKNQIFLEIKNANIIINKYKTKNII